MLVCLTATAGYAQQVLVENGKIVIDASAIPNTQVKKARTTDGTNTKRGTNDATNISSVVSDEKCIISSNCRQPASPPLGRMP